MILYWILLAKAGTLDCSGLSPLTLLIVKTLILIWCLRKFPIKAVGRCLSTCICIELTARMIQVQILGIILFYEVTTFQEENFMVPSPRA